MTFSTWPQLGIDLQVERRNFVIPNKSKPF